MARCHSSLSHCTKSANGVILSMNSLGSHPDKEDKEEKKNSYCQQYQLNPGSKAARLKYGVGMPMTLHVLHVLHVLVHVTPLSILHIFRLFHLWKVHLVTRVERQKYHKVIIKTASGYINVCCYIVESFLSQWYQTPPLLFLPSFLVGWEQQRCSDGFIFWLLLFPLFFGHFAYQMPQSHNPLQFCIIIQWKVAQNELKSPKLTIFPKVLALPGHFQVPHHDRH